MFILGFLSRSWHPSGAFLPAPPLPPYLSTNRIFFFLFCKEKKKDRTLYLGKLSFLSFSYSGREENPKNYLLQPGLPKEACPAPGTRFTTLIQSAPQIDTVSQLKQAERKKKKGEKKEKRKRKFGRKKVRVSAIISLLIPSSTFSGKHFSVIFLTFLFGILVI